MKEITLPSGGILKISVAPFGVAKSLFQAVLKELKGVDVSTTTEIASLYKDFFCLGYSSKEIEAALWECFKRCTINYDEGGDLKIDGQTFESEARRQDYISVCMEVAQENIAPFAKSLYAEFQRGSAMIAKNPA